MRNVVVVPYDANWPEAFAAEARELRRALQSVALGIHHIGSTSVPGLAAKSVIDILLVAASHARLDASDAAMVALGYEPRSEFGIAGRRFFVKGGDDHRTHHVHAFEPGHREIAKHVDFRDYLRAKPHEAQRYGALKLELARRFPTDIEAYMDGKAALIAELQQRAVRWRPSG